MTYFKSFPEAEKADESLIEGFIAALGALNGLNIREQDILRKALNTFVEHEYNPLLKSYRELKYRVDNLEK
jgi:hypothetical protein